MSETSVRQDQQQYDAAAPPRMWASSSKVFVSAPFQVTFTAGATWMQQHGVTEASVRDAAGSARLFLEGSTHHADAALGSSIAEAAAPAAGAGTVVVKFNYCRSYCNSSRLHLGGRVVVVLELLDGLGNVVARPQTQPLMLCSKPTLHSSPSVETAAPPTASPLVSHLSLADGLPPFVAAQAQAQAQAQQWPQYLVAAPAGSAAADSGAEDPMARQLAELEATLYGQLLKLQYVKYILLQPR
eukprot:m51a1_g4271 hypothetical protein (242) ;mRNA; f:304590-305584